jgi:pimeloyl-ACP methyl ester carboxylesterase
MRGESTHSCDCISLADGRRLVFTVSGPPSGRPVIYCHGAIGTPLGRSVDLDAITTRLEVRYIAVSRPGIGGSDRAPGRRVADFAADVRQLVDAIGLDEFDVAGVSAGGPYALAIAHALGERVRRVALCSSLSPLCAPAQTPGLSPRIRLGLAALARAPKPCAAVGDAALPLIRRHPELLTRVVAAHAARDERAALEMPRERRAVSDSFLDAAAGGVGGMIDDYLAYARRWGFAVNEVERPVDLWHGAQDPLVPIEHALQLAITLPRCRMFFDPAEGHHFFRRRLEEILRVLIGRQARPVTAVATGPTPPRA